MKKGMIESGVRLNIGIEKLNEGNMTKIDIEKDLGNDTEMTDDMSTETEVGMNLEGMNESQISERIGMVKGAEMLISKARTGDQEVAAEKVIPISELNLSEFFFMLC